MPDKPLKSRTVAVKVEAELAGQRKGDILLFPLAIMTLRVVEQ